MASFFAPKHRSVVPRWRLFASTSGLRELDNAPRGPVALPDAPVDQLRDWEAFGTVWHATDLISAAVVSMQPETALDAAKFLTSRAASVQPSALALAQRILNPGDGALDEQYDWDWPIMIRKLRSSVRRDPRSAMQWADLALAHTVLGNRTQAIRAMTVAHALAPDNRFVLRSAARCFLHWGEPDRAHQLLKASPATLSDPWLLSAEIAMASARHRRSRLFTEGRRMVKSGDFSSYDISELACGLGSAEFEAGSRRHAVPLLTRSMERPTENAVAQVEWVFNKDNRPPPALDAVENVPRLYEAMASEHYFKGEWDDAVHCARQWLEDQPFSSRPADLGSYAASLLGRYSEAVGLLVGARASNPDDQMILNNLTYFSVLAGDVSGAQRWMNLVKWDQVEAADLPIFTATSGLLKFRLGDAEAGRAAYVRAVRDGIERRDARIEAIALMNFSREEFLSGHYERGEERLRQARAAAKRAHGEDIKTMLERLEARRDMPSRTSSI